MQGSMVPTLASLKPLPDQDLGQALWGDAQMVCEEAGAGLQRLLYTQLERLWCTLNNLHTQLSSCLSCSPDAREGRRQPTG